MSIASTIMTNIRAIGPKLKAIGPKGLAAKGVGLAGIGVAVYDSHAWGKLCAYENKNTKNANAALDYFNNTQYLDNGSRATAKMKQALFNWEIGSTIRGAWNATTGYIGGFFSGMGRHIVPLAASGAALCLKGKKGLIGAGALGAWGIWSAIRHTCSHFNHKP